MRLTRLALAIGSAAPMMALLALLVGAGFDLQTSEEARLACLAVIVSAFPWAVLTFRHINRNPDLNDEGRRLWKQRIGGFAAFCMPVYYLRSQVRADERTSR